MENWMERLKDPKHQRQGLANRAIGKQFESRLDAAFELYRLHGAAAVEKTPEPMKVLKSLGNGRFIACFEKKAQPDYKGTLKGGRAVMFEAKYTAADRIEQSRVSQGQAEYLEYHHRLGARCFVVAGFRSGAAYCVPWPVWSTMKDRFGRKYATEADLQEFQVPVAKNGALLVLNQKTKRRVTP